MINTKEYYFNTFKVCEAQLRRLAGECLSSGGDYSDLFFENSLFYNLLLRDNEVSSGGFHCDYGVGIRVLKGEKTGYAYSESTDMKAMSRAAKAASAIAANDIKGILPGEKGVKIDYKNLSNRNVTGITRDYLTKKEHDYSYISGLSDEDIMNILAKARDEAAIYVPSENNGGRPARKFFPGSPNPAADRYPMEQDWRTMEIAEIKPYLMKLQDKITAKDSRIFKVIAMVSGQVTDVLMYNSFEELKYDTRPLGNIVVTAIFMQDGQVVNKSCSRSFRKGAEMLNENMIEEIADEIVKNLDDNFKAIRPKGGEMPVVMGAGSSGILLHEAMGHAFEADFNRKGTSIFSDKMNQRVCPEGINIVDDATIQSNRGSLNFDDEGVPGQRTTMVEDGVLTSYLHDRISAKSFGATPTGNGRRESFRYNPIPRMRNTYMENGNANPQDIIASVDKGIYVDEFANGQVKIGEGDFTFYVKNGYLIENGKLTTPIKDINIIGNGPRALSDIVAVGNDMEINDGTWTCGKGQSVPVSLGIPTVMIKNLIVGGE